MSVSAESALDVAQSRAILAIEPTVDAARREQLERIRQTLVATIRSRSTPM